MILGLDFKAVSDKESDWFKTYTVIDHGIQDPFYFLLPAFDSSLLWLSSKRQAVHKEMDKFNSTLKEIIAKKRESIHNDVLEDNEKDLLTLMIEAEAKGEGFMSDQELKVSYIMVACVISHIFVR